jgi:alpha-amylase
MALGIFSLLMSHLQYLMVDIVTNHMAYMGCGSCVDYSRFKPFSSVCAVLPQGNVFLKENSQLTRGLIQSSYFHLPCSINYDSQTSVEVCVPTAR